MTTYLHNLRLWLTGFGKLGTLDYKPGWNAWKFLPVYLFDIGLNVLTGGAVCTVSRRAQDHRSGWVWDKLLDTIEHFDEKHGALSGPTLWGSVECSKRVQIFVIAAWAAGVILWM
jgi:hypothetical protein